MRDTSDMELLQEYARRGSEPAFAELVQRHIALVYSAALRQIGMAAQAEEITQAVFVILARKANALRAETVLAAWLYETTRLTSISFLRGERRRQFREQEACMDSTLETSLKDPAWEQLAPLLDEALMRLGKEERQAVILRFFQEKNLREVGLALNINEAAAQKRVGRALEKLRKFFANRGVGSTTAAIAETISARSVQVAPAALAQSVTTLALAKGAAASTSTLTLIKGALKIMAWTKVKTALVTSVILLLAAGTTTIVAEKVARAVSLRQRLADGSVLVLNQVSFGDKHEFVHGGQTINMDWPGHDMLLVEFGVLGENAAASPLVKPPFFRQFRCLIRGEDGFEYAEEFFPNGFKKYPEGFFSYVETSIFPRDSKWLWFEIEKSPTNHPYGPWQTVAQFKVPNPARPANHRWAANPTPATNHVDGMDLVLDEVTVAIGAFTPRDIWNHTVTVPTRVFNHGVLQTNWGPVEGQVADASGNYNSVIQKHRSLDPRYVWKLDMDFETVSNFTAENLATIDVPRSGETTTLELMNLPVTISRDGNWIEASIPTNQPDFGLQFVGATDEQGDHLQDGSGSWSQFNFRKGYFMATREGMTTTDVKPAKVTLAVVPNVHTTFYVQPRLVASQ